MLGNRQTTQVAIAMTDPQPVEPQSTVSWASISFEMKGLFAFHMSMMVLFIAGPRFLFVEQLFVAIGIAAIVVLWSIIRRIRNGWRWRGASMGRRIWALLGTVLIAYFVGVGTGFSAAGFLRLAPWAFAGIGIGLFGALNILNIVHRSEAGFRADCEAAAGTRVDERRPPVPRWKQTIRIVFTVLFVAAWLEGVTTFYVYQSIFAAGSPVATNDKPVPFNNKGTTMFVSRQDKQLVDLMLSIMMVSIPTVIAIGFFLQYGLKMRLEPFRTD